jgi:hypothetical protein
LQGPYFQQQLALQPQPQPLQGAAALDISGMLGGTGSHSSINSSSSGMAGGGVGQSSGAVGQANESNSIRQQLGSTLSSPSQQQQQQQQQDPVVMQTLLLQQQEIKQLQKQNRQLRAAVCKLDPSAAVCSSRDGRSKSSSAGRRSSRSRLKGAPSSDGVWSD